MVSINTNIHTVMGLDALSTSFWRGLFIFAYSLSRPWRRTFYPSYLTAVRARRHVASSPLPSAQGCRTCQCRSIRCSLDKSGFLNNSQLNNLKGFRSIFGSIPVRCPIQYSARFDVWSARQRLMYRCALQPTCSIRLSWACLLEGPGAGGNHCSSPRLTSWPLRPAGEDEGFSDVGHVTFFLLRHLICHSIVVTHHSWETGNPSGAPLTSGSHD